jgi:hypothetical protein
LDFLRCTVEALQSVDRPLSPLIWRYIALSAIEDIKTRVHRITRLICTLLKKDKTIDVAEIP